MDDRILFVDDEQGVLDGYERLLRKEFSVFVALGGFQGLLAIEKHGPFAVVISDMRMPGMNGAEFLSQVRKKAPNTARMLLTGFSDISAAIDAVNEGNILRFLTKPTTKETLVEAISLGAASYKQATEERELLKRTRLTEQFAATVRAADICPWDNFEGPTGLPGPTQAHQYLAPLIGRDAQCYVAMLKLTAHQIIEERYGEELAGDYLSVTAQGLVHVLHAEDKLFHWERDVLMAVIRRRLSPSAMRSEISRLTATSREHLLEVNGRKIMVATPIVYDLAAAVEFRRIDDMLNVLNAGVGRGD